MEFIIITNNCGKWISRYLMCRHCNKKLPELEILYLSNLRLKVIIWWKTTQIIPCRYVESSAQWYMANYFPDETMTFVEVFLLFINLNSLLIKKHCWPGRSDPWKPTVGSVAQFCQWSTWRPKRRIALKENYEMLIMLIPAWCSDNDI